MPTQTQEQHGRLTVVSVTGNAEDSPAELFRTASEWPTAHPRACLLYVSFVPFYLCPDDCEPRKDQTGLRLDLTLDLS
ncbi:hypothetical protein [Streptomyces sp. EKS3.2]|uniref:hypothetical protein n=1 Tax=Streptomyces sp. EKS3.2 TaxID=3461008 RepID=UPI004041EBB1